MPRVSFTSNLRPHVECEAAQVEGATVAEALDAVFAKNPRLRVYLRFG
jgi:molybdopterin converting factor small subunit